MSKRFPLSLTLIVGVVSILLGLGLGAVLIQTIDVGSDGNDNGSGDTEGNHLILESASKDIADQVWDPEHHSLVDLDARIEGRVIMIELSVEDEEDQYHFLLLPDTDYLGMINNENVRSLRGAIMVELMNEDNTILPRLFIGQHLTVQGPLVTDIRNGHGWNEIDPALIISET